jgi:hypothetical protein
MKLGLIKIFVKTMTKEEDGFNHLRQKMSMQKQGQDRRKYFRRSLSVFVMIPTGTRLKAYVAGLWEIKSQKCTWKSWESYFPHTAPWGATSR